MSGHDLQIISIIIGIASTALIAYLFKYVWKPKTEQIFEKNAQYTANLLFGHLAYVDSYKTSIFELLEKQGGFDANSPSSLILSKYGYDEVFRFLELVMEQIDLISKVQKYLTYITLEQYLTVQQYAVTIRWFIHKVGNQKFTIFIVPKYLEFHRYYAKRIIELFDDLTPISFRNKWEEEFNKIGGHELVKKPKLEPGDLIGPDYNLHNELLYYDSTFSAIMKELDEIKEMVRNLHNSKS